MSKLNNSSDQLQKILKEMEKLSFNIKMQIDRHILDEFGDDVYASKYNVLPGIVTFSVFNIQTKGIASLNLTFDDIVKSSLDPISFSPKIHELAIQLANYSNKLKDNTEMYLSNKNIII